MYRREGVLIPFVTLVIVAAVSCGLTFLAGGGTGDLIAAPIANAICAWLFLVPAIRGFDTYKRRGKPPELLGMKERRWMGGLSIVAMIAVALSFPKITEIRRTIDPTTANG